MDQGAKHATHPETTHPDTRRKKAKGRVDQGAKHDSSCKVCCSRAVHAVAVDYRVLWLPLALWAPCECTLPGFPCMAPPSGPSAWLPYTGQPGGEPVGGATVSDGPPARSPTLFPLPLAPCTGSPWIPLAPMRAAVPLVPLGPAT